MTHSLCGDEGSKPSMGKLKRKVSQQNVEYKGLRTRKDTSESLAYFASVEHNQATLGLSHPIPCLRREIDAHFTKFA